MNTNRVLDQLEGIHNIESVMELLDITRNTAIKYISILNKQGYVKTKQLSSKKRIYNISRKNRILGKSYYEIINKYSPVKIVEAQVYKIYGREPSLEETLIFAIKTKKLRVILAALVLFRHIDNWSLLSELANQNNTKRKIGVLYDLSKSLFKVRRMSLKFRNSALPKEQDFPQFIIDGLKSKDFKDIENEWKVYIPFNMKDLEVYIK